LHNVDHQAFHGTLPALTPPPYSPGRRPLLQGGRKAARRSQLGQGWRAGGVAAKPHFRCAARWLRLVWPLARSSTLREKLFPTLGSGIFIVSVAVTA
jgi:hypothetical protein